ncbi:DUF2161 family putative PD-(D/E)XK-type phosphodiesterase [Paenibacillus filicis]|uniref:DUF2161 family putative PD-(D/E)XK-type phosphodiesterase n=1 Tax=Paenibacillus gyeongsangnamensis TaxID=3388067 RepID=A0ABT4Q8Y2_9BACL|nr:DUF2161 family putative PD-(D/E)XK-type phosphodiesterase [Paenibacillus filicis]MCZ8513284.1 DUF2161 family putative PD-(D/E)XK-type phosphodiesterase [Paenibacillus filicis]
MAIKRETELYAPVKAYLEALGYSVRGEVNHCDIVAIRGEEPPLIVELKKSFSIPLLLQAIDRLKITRSVYVAFELPAKGRAPHGASWTELRKLCGMLGVGMLTVQFYKSRKPKVQVECHPPEGEQPFYAVPRHNKRAASRLVTEFQERRADYNMGGSHQRKLVTAYREKSLQLAWLLKIHGTLSPKRLRELTGNGRAAGFLQNNVYLWFQRVERGLYRLAPAGEEALVQYAHVLAGFQKPRPLEPVETI